MSQYTPQLPQQQPSSEETLNQPRQSQQMPPQQGYPEQSPMYQQPPQRPPKRRKKWPWFLLAVILVIVIVVYAASPKGTSTPTQQTPAPTSTIAPTPTAASHVQIGQTVDVGTVGESGYTWQITINGIKQDGTQDYLHAGNVLLVLDVSFKNVSSVEQTASSFDFSLRDLQGQQEGVSYDPNAAQSLDGVVEPGSPLKGTLVFEAPAGTHQFELFYNTIGVSGQVIWDITV